MYIVYIINSAHHFIVLSVDRSSGGTRGRATPCCHAQQASQRSSFRHVLVRTRGALRNMPSNAQ